ncbi:hypothetical protein IAQ61_009014 [Plenodomus lingam]|uniref:uncharacterized protein n=1 Tax=Leptosphaeria maculans TaxID=5022 RepID=UPI0033215BCA|nr:hypothetical protein IAQ61_009014 [Plenodomus lingam]
MVLHEPSTLPILLRTRNEVTVPRHGPATFSYTEAASWDGPSAMQDIDNSDRSRRYAGIVYKSSSEHLGYMLSLRTLH